MKVLWNPKTNIEVPKAGKMVNENSFYKAENYFLDVVNVNIVFIILFTLLFRFLLELGSCILLSRFSRGFLDPGDMGSGVEIDLNFTLRRFIGFFLSFFEPLDERSRFVMDFLSNIFGDIFLGNLKLK